MKSTYQAGAAAFIGLAVLVTAVGTVIGGGSGKDGAHEGRVIVEPGPYPIRDIHPVVPPVGWPRIEAPAPVDCGPPGECHFPCTMGPSCPICLDIGCHPPGYDIGWNDRDWNTGWPLPDDEEGAIEDPG